MSDRRDNVMRHASPLRSLLFVPAHRREMIGKARAAGADAVILDLEDAVPEAEKRNAREAAREALTAGGDTDCLARIDRRHAEEDLERIVGPGLEAVIAPKIESDRDILELDRLLLQAEEKAGLTPRKIPLIALIESAAGVRNIEEIVAAGVHMDRLRTVAFGAADFTLDMGIEMTPDAAELAYPRARLAIACRAGGVEPPLDTPYMLDIRDDEKTRVDASRARQLGFQGKLCIHPRQVAICNEVFSPTAEQARQAAGIVEAFERARIKGLGAIEYEGRMIDKPIVENARRIVEIAARQSKQGVRS